MKIRPEYKMRQIASEHAVVVPGRPGGAPTRIVSLNDSARFLWERLFGKEFTERDAARLLCERYGIDRRTALRDADGWTQRLRAAGLLEES